MIGKVVVSGISLILVVGVVIGVIAGVHRHSTSSEGATDDLSTSVKPLASICGPALYKEACMETLGGIAQNKTATPMDFLKAAIVAAIEEVKASSNLPVTLVSKTDDPREKMALESCKGLMESAIADAQAAFSMVGDSDLHTTDDRIAELRNWLSFVISYQGACVNELSIPEYQSAMEGGILNSTRLTSNALSIVNQISSILSAFDLKLDPSALKSRRLLDVSDEQVLSHDGGGGDGYPSWFSAADRKLLASNNNARLRPNAVVAKDGSGQFKTIAAALNAYPKNHRGRYVIYVKAGIYNEHILVTKDQVNVFMYGDGPRKTIVTGKKSYAQGINTMNTATFAAEGPGFVAKSMGFQNTAGPDGHQAVALRVQSEMSAFVNCRMDGYQDTLYVQTKRQFYRNCVISGTVDFIFGDSPTVIQNSLIIVRLPNPNQKNIVTAQGRKDPGTDSAIFIHNCRIVPEVKYFAKRFQIPTYLGRPWKAYSRTVIMESTLGDLIQPAGFLPWDDNSYDFHNTLYYAEYRNRGPGANTSKRVNWKGRKVITNRREALQFTVAPFLQANLWLRQTGVPFLPGLRY